MREGQLGEGERPCCSARFGQTDSDFPRLADFPRLLTGVWAMSPVFPVSPIAHATATHRKDCKSLYYAVASQKFEGEGENCGTIV